MESSKYHKQYNKDHKEEMNANQRRYYWKDRNGYKNRWLIRAYGITLEDYERMVKERDGRCDICGNERKLCVDHDHVTGRVRGLLCAKCNQTLGLINDEVRVAENIVLYLDRGTQ